MDMTLVKDGLETQNASYRNIMFARVVILGPDSLFSLISYKTSSHVILNSVPIDRERAIVVAKVSNILDRSELSELVRMEREVDKYWLLRSGKYSHVVAIKTKCKVLTLAEECDIALLQPICISKGTRDFYVAGSLDRLEKFYENVASYYGSKRIIISLEKNFSRVIRELDRRVINCLLWKLTDREVEILKSAHTLGLLDSKRRVNLGDLARSLGVKKSTLSIMLRKALSKIINEVVTTEGKEE